mgnify:CR=1 FL=1
MACLVDTMKTGYDAPFDWVLDHVQQLDEPDVLAEALTWGIPWQDTHTDHYLTRLAERGVRFVHAIDGLVGSTIRQIDECSATVGPYTVQLTAQQHSLPMVVREVSIQDHVATALDGAKVARFYCPFTPAICTPRQRRQT